MDGSSIRMRTVLAALALVAALAGVSIAATGGEAMPGTRAVPAARPDRALLMSVAGVFITLSGYGIVGKKRPDSILDEDRFRRSQRICRVGGPW